jgi:hypothetical protein
VAKYGAHLSRGEVEYRSARGIIDIAAAGTLDYDGRECTTVADQVPLSV